MKTGTTIVLMLLLAPAMITNLAGRSVDPDPSSVPVNHTAPDEGRAHPGFSDESTLPAEWTGLAGFRAPAGMMLRWSTASEHNSAWFKIESRHSPDADWKVLGIVAAAGQSSSPRFYSWLHNHPPKDGVEYRLRQIDASGNESSTGTLKIDPIVAGKPRITQLERQPSNSETLIAIYCGEVTSGELVIHDNSGRTRQIVFQQLELHPGSYRFRIDTSTLPEGKYTLRLTTSDESSATDLIVSRFSAIP
jgi:hypothetical protein